jgi:transcriptional regulator with GAF, ATPase, and Fis domain
MQDRLAFLRRLNFLSNVPQTWLPIIAEQLQPMDLPASVTLFHQGDEGDALYIIVEGTLSIIQDGVLIVTRGPGEVVGEFALIDNNRRSATVASATAALLLKWPRRDFQETLRQCPELLFAMVNLMLQKLRQPSVVAEPSATALQRPHADAERPEAQTLRLTGDDWLPEKLLVYRSEAMRNLMHLVARLGNSRNPLLITGESGTGKELIARAAHHYSPYRQGSFVALNCGAIPESLAESELFGHERGAFTGATAAHQGKLELAHEGTLFLDEVGDLSSAIQVKLLRVIEDGRFMRVGGVRPLCADIRVIAATNRDLQREVREGRFRKDLFYRLSAIPLHIPPLRERREDIPPLVDHFLSAASGSARRIAPKALAHLMEHPWPGNVRELRNVIERAVIMARTDEIQLDEMRWCVSVCSDLETALSGPPADMTELDRAAQRLLAREGDANILDMVERILIHAALQREQGNQSRAAQLLGIERKQIARRLKKYGLTDEQPNG